MTRFAVPVIVMMLTAVAWAADVVTLEDWKAQKLGAKGIPDGWLGGQTWGLPQYDMTVEENDGQRVLHLKSKIESSTIRKDIKGKVNLKETPILEWTWKGVVLPDERATAGRRARTTRRPSSTSCGHASPRRCARRSSATSGTRPRRPAPS